VDLPRTMMLNDNKIDLGWLELLEKLPQAGHNGHDNETILSIIEELRETSLIIN